MRTCVGCRRRAPADRLVRVARRDGGALAVGRDLPGRGAWLCRGSRRCYERAVRKGAFERALRAPVDRAAAERLAAELGFAPDVGG